MLGKRVICEFDINQAAIENKKNKLIYKGKAIVKRENNFKYITTYYIGTTSPEARGLYTVVAKLVYEGSCIFIVSDFKTMCYRPEICEAISLLKLKKPNDILCLYEKSCGGVVYTWYGNKLLFLLIKNNRSRYWTFPKGHVEMNENEKQTAKREIKEETGLDVRIYNNFRQCCEYHPYGYIRKHVVLFIAESKEIKVSIQKEELDSYIWVEYKNAVSLLHHWNDKKVLMGAHKCITKNKIHDNINPKI